MKLTKKQQLYIEASLANPSMSDAQISKEYSISSTQICKWKKDPEFVSEIDKKLKAQWKDAAKKAQAKMIELMDSKRSDVALKAAAYVMDSNGYKAAEKLEVNAEVHNIKVTIDDD